MPSWYQAGNERYRGCVIAATVPATPNPLQIFGANLLAWYKADTGVTTSGGNVTAVADQSGNGYNLSNSGTVPFSATGLSGTYPAFVFAVANAAALKVASFGIGTGTEISVFVVGQMNLATDGYGGAVSYGAGGGNDYNATGTGAFLTRNSTNAEINTTSEGAGIVTSMTTGAVHRFGVIFDTTDKIHYVDNVVGSSAAQLVTAWTNSGTLVVGNRYSSGAVGGAAWDGPIAEVVIVNRDATSGERNSLDTYFTGKYP